ncbi:MAG: M12 family metallo-peptidase, partial [Verrucomicrobiota bacterium]
ARMANAATIWENQLGVRLLVSELILTPNTPAYPDVGDSLSDFRNWGNLNRPQSEFPRSVAARFGNRGFSGSVIGWAYLSAVQTANAYSINQVGYTFTLVSHEMGHNFGSGHSSGGIMNSSIRRGNRNFYHRTAANETSAKDIYDYVNSRLFGPAPQRHAEEIPFCRDDFHVTPVNTPIQFNPIANDQNQVLYGAANNLSLAEVSRIDPVHAGTVEMVGTNEVLFTPNPGFEGYCWFSYSLQGDVGNSGEGWLHRGDVAIRVGDQITAVTNLILGAGETFVFVLPGSGGGETVSQPATQAWVNITLEDLGIIRAEPDAAGVDTFTITRSSGSYVFHVTYVDRQPVTRADVVMSEGSSPLRFNPMSNDDAVGYRRPHQVNGRIAFDGYSTNFFPTAFRLVSATNLNPEKGGLSLEELNMVDNGTNDLYLTGVMNFAPVTGATGVADVEYVVVDAAGHLATDNVSIVFSFLRLTCPTSPVVHIPEPSGLLVEGVTESSSRGGLSGNVQVGWQEILSPTGANAVFEDPDAIDTAIRFSGPGAYQLRVTGTDSGYSTFQDLTVVVTTNMTLGGTNLGPMVTLTNLTLNAGSVPYSLALADPRVSDDGRPNPPATYVTEWTQLPGSATVTFNNPAAIITSATFPFPTNYTLRLMVNDGAIKTF